MTVRSTQDSAQQPAGPSGPLNVALWILQAGIAIYFLYWHAVPKLFGLGTSVEMFDAIGLGQWLRYFTGTVELVGAIALLIPRLAGLAALGLAGVMVGATLTNLFVIDGGIWAVVTVVLLVLLLVVAWGRRAQTMALLAQLRR